MTSMQPDGTVLFRVVACGEPRVVGPYCHMLGVEEAQYVHQNDNGVTIHHQYVGNSHAWMALRVDGVALYSVTTWTADGDGSDLDELNPDYDEDLHGDCDGLNLSPGLVMKFLWRPHEDGGPDPPPRFVTIDIGRLIARYGLVAGKAIAGLVRFLFEDVLQGSCQIVLLINTWSEISWYSRIFTLGSVAAGFILSLSGPLKEYLAVRKVRHQAGVRVTALTIDGDSPSYAPMLADVMPLHSPSNAAPEPNNAVMPSNAAPEPNNAVMPNNATPEPNNAMTLHSNSAQPQATSVQRGRVQDQMRIRIPPDVTLMRNVSIQQFLFQQGRWRKHASIARVALCLTASAFWICMAMLPFLLNSQITCDGDPPTTGVMIFSSLSVIDLGVQVWVALHSRQGYMFILTNGLWFGIGSGLSVLGRFDTFGDVMSTSKIMKCQASRDFSISGMAIDLATISKATLIFGVFLLQAVPGIVLLVRLQLLPIAFKLNEFNLLLTIMEQDDEQFLSGPGDAEVLEQFVPESCDVHLN